MPPKGHKTKTFNTVTDLMNNMGDSSSDEKPAPVVVTAGGIEKLLQDEE